MVHDLQLAVDQSFVVQVVDAQQKPAAHVPVQAEYLQQEVAGRTSRHTLGETDAEGRFSARHVQTWSSRVAPRGSLLPVAIETDLPGLVVAQEIDAKLPPAEPIVLVLPPAGEIEVTVRDAFGKPVQGVYFDLQEEVAEPARAMRGIPTRTASRVMRTSASGAAGASSETTRCVAVRRLSKDLAPPGKS